LQNDAAELKLHAERKAGGRLAGMEKRPAGRPPDNSSHGARDFPPTLADLGLNYSQSQRWQRMASIAASVFEAHVPACARRSRLGGCDASGQVIAA